MTITCPYFSPEVVVKFTRMATRHFVTLIKIGMHLIERLRSKSIMLELNLGLIRSNVKIICKNNSEQDLSRSQSFLLRSVKCRRWHVKYRVPVAQLVEHRVIMREIVSSTPTEPTLRLL